MTNPTPIPVKLETVMAGNDPMADAAQTVCDELGV